MNVYKILVPTVKPESIAGKNRFFTIRYHQEWDKKVRAITGGLTVLPVVKGTWTNPKDGEIFEERMIPVEIMCSREQIERIADETAKHYRQLAIYFAKVSEEVTIKHY